jgi:hypothetical protein
MARVGVLIQQHSIALGSLQWMQAIPLKPFALFLQLLSGSAFVNLE